MKNFKKVLLTGTITLATLLTMTITSNAATVKVTGDVINVRKEASTDSTVIAKLSKDVECEYLGEEGDWYKVKYKTYIGYVSKLYTKLEGEVSNNTEDSEQENTNNDEQDADKDNNEVNNETTEGNDNQSSNQTTNNEEKQNNDAKSEDNTQTEENQIVYKKFNQNTIIKLLPLIHSSNIGEVKKDEEVLILTEASGWSYVQTDEISGWVRTDTLGETKTETNEEVKTTENPSQNNENTTTEKIGYISEDDVNMRKGAGTTYSIIKQLELNTQVTILEEDGNWCKIKVDNTTGYVSKDYVSDSKTVTNRSLSEPRTSKEDNETSENTTTDNTTTSTDSTSKTVSTASSSSKTSTSTTTSKTTTTSSSNTIKGTDVIAYAKSFIGVPYVWGGASSSGFDCSGFTMYVYNHFGVSLPHYTVSQYNSSKGTKITKQSDLKMGDIVFLTDYETGAACGHCGIYISDGNFIHADSSVGYVNISDLNGIYKGRFCGALRIIQ